MIQNRSSIGSDAFFVHPTEGKHPGVIFWPDAIALREAKMAMARRLASSGYSVLVVNQYYRDAHTPLGIKFSDFGDPAARVTRPPPWKLATALTRSGTAAAVRKASAPPMQ